MSDIFYVNNKFNKVTLNPHFHEEYTISLVYKGMHLFSNEKDTYNVEAGMIQVLNPYEFHQTKDSSWAHLNIMPTIKQMNTIASQMLQKEINSQILINTMIKDQKATNLFYSLFTSLDSIYNNRLSIDSKVVEFLEYILKYHSSLKAEEIVNIDINKNKLSLGLEYINSNITNDNLSLDEISNNIGLSKYHFLREFKKETGVTPNQYIQIKKVNKVRSFLKTDASLSSIAYECGFTDQSHMIKVFKRFIGYTPKQFKNTSPIKF
ncbi:AraC family transcriptional regulator [Poseidonibacter lekithochrous]|uniref:AraC family transcriptional regulator n=1 Tax=Poseidonibacter lekithochrous TaxID=1904463 RepID=UPI0008FC6231|nr:AraC family transcriptional regulator [Poseidonibacter lekithochrous]QKJ24313.1 transcriptional regulator, AraC family [Poseidonibacter lekithochrous]